MGDNFQFALADGHPDWTQGQPEFAHMWTWARDRLRFHRGDQFDVATRSEHPEHARRPLRQLDELLEARLGRLPLDTVVEVTSVADGFQMLFRLHQVAEPMNQQLIDFITGLKDTPYDTLDCSGLTMLAASKVAGIRIAHHADTQFRDPQLPHIPAEKALKGDLVFIDKDSSGSIHHVATILGRDVPGFPEGLLVWDSWPHDIHVPGWPTPTLGVGVQVRPAWLPWYDGKIVAYARMPAINGDP